MIGWFMGSRIAQYALAALAVVAGLLGLKAKIKSDGAAEERAKQQREIVNAAKQRADVDDAVSREPDPARRLHDRWGK